MTSQQLAVLKKSQLTVDHIVSHLLGLSSMTTKSDIQSRKAGETCFSGQFDSKATNSLSNPNATISLIEVSRKENSLCRNIFSKPIATAEKATTSSEACSVFTTETRAHLANYSGNIPHCPQLNSDPDESSTFCSDRPNRPRSKAPRTIDGSAVNLRSTQLNSNAVSPLRPMKSFHSVMIDSAPTQSAVSSVADVRSNSQVKTNLQNSLTGSYSGCRSILNHK